MKKKEYSAPLGTLQHTQEYIYNKTHCSDGKYTTSCGALKRLSEKSESFKDSLLDEQSNRIKELEDCIENSASAYIDKLNVVYYRGREINRLNRIIHEKNVMIKNLILERGKVARELAAEKAVHQVDLQATKSAESALLYHEREYEKSLKEKDEVIDDISEELSRSKKREEELIETIKDYQKQLNALKPSDSVKRKKKVNGKKKNDSSGSFHIVVDDIVIPNDMYELLYFIFD